MNENSKERIKLLLHRIKNVKSFTCIKYHIYRIALEAVSTAWAVPGSRGLAVLVLLVGELGGAAAADHGT